MIKLIFNELEKIVRKKGFIIMLLVMLGFCLLTNLIYKSLDELLEPAFNVPDEYLETLKNDPESKDLYVEVKTQNDIEDFLKKYDKDSWQYGYLKENDDINNYYTEINKYEIKLTNDENVYKAAKSNLEELVKKVDNSNWQDFVKEEIESLKTMRNEIDSADEKEAIDINIEILNMRLEKDISYKDDYLSEALDIYGSSKIALLEYKNKDVDKLSKEDKSNYYELRDSYLTNEYIINNKVDANNYMSLYGVLKNLFSEYSFVMMIFIFMIAGSIVSQEFSNGTIKLLLIKPYKRVKILLSKYITVIMSVLFSCLIMILFQVIVGGLFFGFDSLSTPVLVYSSVNDALETYNIFNYVLLNVVAYFPYLLIIGTLAFAASTIFANTALAVVSGFVGYIGGDIVMSLLSGVNKWWIKYLVCFNWDFSPYIFNTIPIVKGVSLPFSLAICFITLLILLIPTFIIFKKKDITNV